MTLEEAHEKIQLVYGCIPIWNSTSWRCRYRSRTFNNDLAGTDNIRDVVAFPKTASASDLMAQAPSPVDPAQLKELGIETK